MKQRMLSTVAVAAVATISLTGCGAKDALDQAKSKASDLATNSRVQDLKSKGAEALKSKMSDATGGDASEGASAGGSAAATGATIDLGKFSGNKKAKIVGAYYTKKRDGKPGPFLVTVTGVKANKVAVCVGPKGARSQNVVLAKGKVKGVQKGTATCK
jgi:predicted small lipoprotein YifL